MQIRHVKWLVVVEVFLDCGVVWSHKPEIQCWYNVSVFIVTPPNLVILPPSRRLPCMRLAALLVYVLFLIDQNYLLFSVW